MLKAFKHVDLIYSYLCRTLRSDIELRENPILEAARESTHGKEVEKSDTCHTKVALVNFVDNTMEV